VISSLKAECLSIDLKGFIWDKLNLISKNAKYLKYFVKWNISVTNKLNQYIAHK